MPHTALNPFTSVLDCCRLHLQAKPKVPCAPQWLHSQICPCERGQWRGRLLKPEKVFCRTKTFKQQQNCRPLERESFNGKLNFSRLGLLQGPRRPAYYLKLRPLLKYDVLASLQFKFQAPAQCILVGADVNGPLDGKPPLIHAVSAFTYDSESPSDPQQKTSSTSLLTLRKRQAEAVGMLVEAGADVGVVEAERKETALHFMCCLCSSEKEDPETERETEELVKFLISRGANVNAEAKKGARPIHAAARFGTAKLIDLLVAQGADLKAKDKNGNGVLFYAAAGDNKKSAEHLMNLGVDVNDENEVGCTCLLYTFGRRVDVDVGPLSEWVPAVPPDYAGLADLFVSRGGDVNGWDEEYSSPLLHQASFWGASGVVRVLLENGVDLDMVDENGNTALHDVGCHPIEEGGPAGPGGVRVLPYWGKSLRWGFYVKLLESRLEIGHLLVSFGVSANLLNNFGHTALSVVTVGGLQGLRGGREIVSFLRSITTQTAEETGQSQEGSDGSASESEFDDEEGEGSESSSESGSESEEEEGEEKAEEGEEE
uniref:Uncharacterized protein n=1 Tax=Chromera velia CCMP2878 TaxID=1169474 RepID=A0A0G4HK07_9ALVE|eukprot:Cvel_28296.t1-p1 / transcript=Cvel_28296.t1 / gene=Cvel_28296 / organism=Chromera_velia_CCMP2878 / gene_product=Serine/threonine-protein phosphatase 6 regulatory, putative / transcript_product=Serine/threonine-protein phosphatase 6 regulatory, putative / location=Cvel_scaffold3671:9076-12274(+) / protein_length=541 / sequence_SO=supercontig / SO=protein_coding / is_pseudo=false